jgi:hypothetical protein
LLSARQGQATSLLCDVVRLNHALRARNTPIDQRPEAGENVCHLPNEVLSVRACRQVPSSQNLQKERKAHQISEIAWLFEVIAIVIL